MAYFHPISSFIELNFQFFKKIYKYKNRFTSLRIFKIFND